MTASSPSDTLSSLVLRDSEALDVPAIQAIYAHHVLHGTSSFELEPPGLKQMQQRRQEVLARGLPYLVVERDGEVLGYAYATPYRPRPAYRFTVEDSVYVREGLAGQGIGSLLLAALIDRCAAGGWRQMIAVAGDASPASVGLHQRHGFELTGILRAVGFKFGAWRDTALLQRALGDGNQALPDREPGAPRDMGADSGGNRTPSAPGSRVADDARR
jgi:phosphinothricin acetyltransferase